MGINVMVVDLLWSQGSALCTRSPQKVQILEQKGIELLKYRSRATTGRGHNLKIPFLAIKLPHKKHIKNYF